MIEDPIVIIEFNTTFLHTFQNLLESSLPLTLHHFQISQSPHTFQTYKKLPLPTLYHTPIHFVNFTIAFHIPNLLNAPPFQTLHICPFSKLLITLHIPNLLKSFSPDNTPYSYPLCKPPNSLFTFRTC